MLYIEALLIATLKVMISQCNPSFISTQTGFAIKNLTSLTRIASCSEASSKCLDDCFRSHQGAQWISLRLSVTVDLIALTWKFRDV